MSLYPVKNKSFQYGRHEVELSHGHIAMQTKGSVIVTIGKCVVMANITHSECNNANFFPLTVYYSERAYSNGKIPGSFTRREGRPSDREVLICRLVDRTIRPMFADGFSDEVQVNLTLLQNDPEVQPDIACLIATSAALVLTDLPFTPVCGIRIGEIDNQFVVNPSEKALETSTLDLVVGASSDSIVMVESSANELSEARILEALAHAHQEMQIAFKALTELKSEEGAPISWLPPEQDTLLLSWREEIDKTFSNQIQSAYATSNKSDRNSALGELHQAIHKHFAEKISASITEELTEAALAKKLDDAIADVEKTWVRTQIIEKKPRIDGRSYQDVRQIDIQVPFLPETHGSVLFTRGETQAIVVATLADEGSAQLIDDITTQTKERFMLHYNFPQYSVGSCGPQLSPKRREIGHGRLARKAILPMLPQNDETFPYVLRIVSEILSSNGSSSMATVCGSSLALMDAGVPIKEAVAGIAMGLVKKDDRYTVLSDILGDEDHYGDMDFKVAGTKNGITALQMDIKTSGITNEILDSALSQAKEGRLHILNVMNKAIDKPRPEFAATAPCMIQFSINPSKIREVIGRGGATIREIIDTYDVAIDISDEGMVKVTASQTENAKKARKHIEEIVLDIEVDSIYEGKIVKIMDFGAFVNILPGRDAFLHISQICHERIENIHHKLSEGQIVRVKVVEIDRQNRVKLTMKDIEQLP